MSERSLWVAVLHRAIMDALIGATDLQSSKSAARMAKRRAIEFLTGMGRDYRMVCTLAGFDPDAVQRGLRGHLSGAQSPNEIRRLARDARKGRKHTNQITRRRKGKNHGR